MVKPGAPLLRFDGQSFISTRTDWCRDAVPSGRCGM